MTKKKGAACFETIWSYRRSVEKIKDWHEKIGLLLYDYII